MLGKNVYENYLSLVINTGIHWLDLMAVLKVRYLMDINIA